MLSIIDKPASGSAPAATSTPNELLDLIGGRLERVACWGEGQDGAVLFRGSVAPGQVVPLHSHADPESFYVLTGRLDAFLLDSSARWHGLSRR